MPRAKTGIIISLLILFLVSYISLIFPQVKVYADLCPYYITSCNTCTDQSSCHPCGCHNSNHHACGWDEDENGRMVRTCVDWTSWDCNECCSTYSCEPCTTLTNYQWCPPPVETVTPSPVPAIPCSNTSVCPSGQDVVCSSNDCHSGNCWCQDIKTALASGQNSCANVGGCSGAAPCPIGQCGSWICNQGVCQSSCSSCTGSGAPASTVTPPPPAACSPGATTCGACTLNCGGGNQDCSNGCSSWNQPCNTQSCNGSITGAKVLMPGNISGEPAISQTVYLDGAGPVTDNPYAFSDITATDHTVSVTNPDATHYSIGYTACTNDTTCHSNAPTAGNSATVAVPGSGNVDLYWHYACTGDAPVAQITPTPVNNATVGNISVTLSWNDISSDWGTFMCPVDTRNNTYTAIYDTNSSFTGPLTACTVNDGSPTTCPSITLLDNTSYWWKVEKSNGPYKDTAGPWKFTVKVPVISGVLFGDLNENACYNVTSGEQPVLNSPVITVSGGSAGSSCTTVGANYSCTVPVPADNTVVSLSSSGFMPVYTAQTGCTSGQDATCSLNNCSITLNGGDTKSVNIGFAVKQWFQANSGSVYSAGDLASFIPNTPLDYDSDIAVDKYFVLNGAGTVLTGSSSLPDFGSFGGIASFNNYRDKNYSSSLTTDYSFFKTQLSKRSTAVGAPSSNFILTNGTINDGTTLKTITNNSVWDIAGNLTVEDSNGLVGINSVFIVSGTITVNGNFTPATSFAFVSQGNITIDPSVIEIHGAYITDGQFIDGATVNRGLKIVGSVGVKGGLSLQRKWQSYKPSEYFVLDPALFINLSPNLGLSSYTWQEVAP